MATAIAEKKASKIVSFQDAQAAALLDHLIVAIVAEPEAVRIVVERADDGATFTVLPLDPKTLKRITGHHGEVARAIRTVLMGMGRKHGNARRYTVVIANG